jgi:hypothetical protein
MKRAVIPVVGLLLAAGALLWLFGGGCSVDTEITKPVERRDLASEEVRTKLKSPDFKEKLEAERQIDKLEPGERRRLLLELARNREAPVRLIAAKHLRKLSDDEVRALLRRMAKEDPDPAVREILSDLGAGSLVQSERCRQSSAPVGATFRSPARRRNARTARASSSAPGPTSCRLLSA